MDFEKRKPLNITINGAEMTEKNGNVYEDYIIKNNEEMKKEIEELKKNMIELENQNKELEDEVEKEESKRIYTKGLMHNLYDSKKKSTKCVLKYEEINNELFDYFEDYKNIFLNLDKYLNVNYLHIIISVYLLIPFLLTVFAYYFESSKLLSLNVVYLLCMFLSLCYLSDLIYNEKFIEQFQKYTTFERKYKKILLEIKNLKTEIKEIEHAIKDIDVIIDES